MSTSASSGTLSECLAANGLEVVTFAVKQIERQPP
jgi:hypothetical protein